MTTLNNEEWVNDNNKWTNDNNEWTDDSIGRRRVEDEGKRMKTIRSNKCKFRPLDLGILKVLAKI
jgi:hypothetical protein